MKALLLGKEIEMNARPVLPVYSILRTAVYGAAIGLDIAVADIADI